MVMTFSDCLSKAIKYRNGYLLEYLLERDHCNEDWLNLLFKICYDIQTEMKESTNSIILM